MGILKEHVDHHNNIMNLKFNELFNSYKELNIKHNYNWTFIYTFIFIEPTKKDDIFIYHTLHVYDDMDLKTIHNKYNHTFHPVKYENQIVRLRMNYVMPEIIKQEITKEFLQLEDGLNWFNRNFILKS